MLTSFTIPAPCKARGELSFPHTVLGRTGKGVFLAEVIRSSVVAGLHFPYTRGAAPWGQTPARAAKQRRRLHSRRSLPGCKKTTPGPPSGGPFVSFPDLREGGRGKTANRTDSWRARGGGGGARAGGVGEERNHGMRVCRWGWRSELQRLCCLLPTRDHTTGSHCSQV